MKDFYTKWKTYQYYILIGIISLVALFFLPMIGSEAGLDWRLPNTFIGWCVFILSKLLVAALNILLFHCFILQAKVNIKDNPRFIEANEILERELIKDAYIPKSPEQWFKEEYNKKGVSIFLTSILSAVGLTQAVLTFDWLSMLTYFFTVLMGIIFGILQMNRTETYWTTEYWYYAKKIEKERHSKLEESVEVVETKHSQPTDDIASDTSGANILVASDYNGNTCPTC